MYSVVQLRPNIKSFLTIVVYSGFSVFAFFSLSLCVYGCVPTTAFITFQYVAVVYECENDQNVEKALKRKTRKSKWAA